MNNAIPVVNAPVVQGKEKLDSVTVPDAGFHVARCYSVVDLGLQYNKKYNKWTPQIEYVYELLGHRQKFYEDDEGPRPTIISDTHTNSMGDRANLRKRVNAAFGKTLTDAQAEVFNVYEFADKTFLIQLTHSAPNAEGVYYANMMGIAPFNPAMAAGVDMTPYNDLHCFHIATHGFESPNFALLPGFKKNKIMESQEAIDHKKAGGKFAEREDFEKEGTAEAPAGQRQPPAPNQAPQQNASSQKPALIMLVNDYSREQYNAQGWTDELMVSKGMAKWDAPAQAPSAPQGPAAPPQGPAGPPAANTQGVPPSNPNLQNLQGDLPADDIGF